MVLFKFILKFLGLNIILCFIVFLNNWDLGNWNIILIFFFIGLIYLFLVLCVIVMLLIVIVLVVGFNSVLIFCINVDLLLFVCLMMV